MYTYFFEVQLRYRLEINLVKRLNLLLWSNMAKCQQKQHQLPPMGDKICRKVALPIANVKKANDNSALFIHLLRF